MVHVYKLIIHKCTWNLSKYVYIASYVYNRRTVYCSVSLLFVLYSNREIRCSIRIASTKAAKACLDNIHFETFWLCTLCITQHRYTTTYKLKFICNSARAPFRQTANFFFFATNERNEMCVFRYVHIYISEIYATVTGIIQREKAIHLLDTGAKAHVYKR